MDHLFFVKIRETLGQLHQSAEYHQNKFQEITAEQGNHVQIGVQIRRELYSVRDKLQEDVNGINVVLQDTVHKKFLAVEA